jgi:hypothetical protein
LFKLPETLIYILNFFNKIGGRARKKRSGGERLVFFSGKTVSSDERKNIKNKIK